MYRISRFIRAALLALPLAAAALPAHAAGSWCAAGKPVRFAGVTWESGNFTSEVLRYVLKNGYGCQTDTVPGSTAATETALSRNDIQVWSEQWTGRSEIVGNAVQAGSVKLIGDTLPGGTKEGWYVPDYVIHGDPARGIKPSAPSLVSMRGALMSCCSPFVEKPCRSPSRCCRRWQNRCRGVVK